jgi:hypothetical protein
MNIGELFVNLGIKGSDKTIGALSDVKKGLGEAKSLSLEMKAGIVGAMYAIERLFAASGATGTGLTNFNALTGISTKSLQQWQFAARQAGVANDEFTGSLKAVQSSITNMLLGKGAPEGLAMVANKVGFDPKRARDTLYVLGQLQKFAQQVPADVGNVALGSFGLSEGVIAAMRRNAFTSDMLKRAPTYSDKEIGSLDRANVAWSNLGQKIEMAIGRFNAKHGGQLVHDISLMTDSVIKLVEALEKLSEKFKVLETVSHAIEGIANTFKIITEITNKLQGNDLKKGDLLYTPPGQEAVPGLSNSPMAQFFKSLFQEALPGFSGSPVGQFIKSNTGGGNSAAPEKPYKGPMPWGGITPNVAPIQKAGQGNVQIQQSLHFQHDGKDHQKNSDSHKKAIKDAYRQLQSQVQGS